MEDMRQEQLEALQFAVDYVKKLVPAFQTVVGELRNEKQDDTIDLLNQAIEGLNFVIEIYNATSSLLNEKDELFQNHVIEEKVQAMNAALKEHDDLKTADAIEDGIIPFLDIFAQIAKVFITQ